MSYLCQHGSMSNTCPYAIRRCRCSLWILSVYVSDVPIPSTEWLPRQNIHRHATIVPIQTSGLLSPKRWTLHKEKSYRVDGSDISNDLDLYFRLNLDFFRFLMTIENVAKSKPLNFVLEDAHPCECGAFSTLFLHVTVCSSSYGLVCRWANVLLCKYLLVE